MGYVVGLGGTSAQSRRRLMTLMADPSPANWLWRDIYEAARFYGAPLIWLWRLRHWLGR